jgi:HeH/LEM domain-containing protein
MANFTAEKQAAYHGRLGQQDTHYTDPGYTGGGGVVGSHEADEAEAAVVHDEPPAQPAEEEAPAEGNDDLDNFTVAELKEELDALGVEYNPKAHKAELLELVKKAEEES